MQIKDSPHRDETGRISEKNTIQNEYTPPRGRIYGRPPMNVVVISSPESSGTSSGGGGTFTSPAVGQMGDSHRDDGFVCSVNRPAPVSLGSSSFKLMPRNSEAMMCSPLPMSRGRRSFGSRKRGAHSIASSPFFRSDEDHEDSHFSVMMGEEDVSSPERFSPTLLNMEALTINSPMTQQRKVDEIASPPKMQDHNAFRPAASSFSLYSSSPAESVQRNTTGSLSGSVGSMVAAWTPCTSAKSSPRHVPLIIIPTLLQQAQDPSPLRLPHPGRRPPPVHFGLSKIYGRPEHFATPQRTSQSSLHPSSDLISIPGAVNTAMETSEVPWTPTNGGDVYASAGTTPRTPLPRITLTPKTPLSARRSNNPRLPEFPASTEDEFTVTQSSSIDDVELMMDDLLEGFTEQVPSPSPHPNPPMSLFPLLTFNPDSSNSLALSDASPGVSTPPVVRLAGSPPRFAELNTGSSTPVSTNEQDASSFVDVEALGFVSKSAMTPSRFGGFLPEMRAEARLGVMEAEIGSLSDSDEEEFVLACPLSIASHQKADKKDHQSPIHSNRRVKPRRQCSKDISIELSGPGSVLSLTSNQMSSTSLFGMDIVQEAGCSLSSSTPRAMTPFSGLASMNRRSFGSFSALLRRESERSLVSLELCLEEQSFVSRRDLVTPPAISQPAISPPPLVKKPLLSRKPAITVPITSVCISSAVKRSASLAIAHMAFQEPYAYVAPT